MSEWDAFPLVGAEPAAPASDDPWAAFPIVQPPAAPAPEPTNMGAARELVKGIPSGAVGIVGTGISGAAALDTAIDASAEARARNLVGGAMFALRDDNSPENRRRVGENLIREAAREYERMPDSEGAFAVNQIARQIIAGKEPDMSLLPEAPGQLKDDPLFKAGEAVSEFGKGILPARPGYEDSTARMLGEGLGSLLGGIGVSVVPGVGAVAGGVLFTTAGSGEAVQRAIAEGATEEQVLLAAKRGLIPGATDLAPVEILLGRLPNPLRTVATKLIGNVGVPKFVEAVGKIGAQAAIEAFQEGGQQALQNAIERYTYNPDQAIAEGIAENAALGGGVGAIAEAGKLALQGFAGRRGGTPPPAAPPATAAPAPPAAPMLALPAPALITPPPEGAITLDPRDTAAAAGPRSGPYAAPPESAILLASGEAPEDIMAMNPAERAAAAQEAVDLGVAPLSQAESDAAMQPVVAAYDAERPDSPRITDEDRASPIPTGLIDDGKAEIDALIAGLDPRNPAEAALVTPPPAAPLASATETPATAPSAPAAAGVAPQGGVAAPVTTPAPQDGAAPVAAPSPQEIEAARAEVNTDPTPGQAQAGNYKKAHVKVQGLDLSIENPKGSIRTNKDPNGPKWSVEMPADYGYIRRTEGADGDQVDFYLGPNPESDFVLVVNQVDPETAAFDEHKIILGTNDIADAAILYTNGFSDGKGARRLGSFTPMTMAEFKAWLKEGDLSKPTAPIVTKPTAPSAKTDETDKTPPTPAAPTIEPRSEKSIIVRGVSEADGPRVFAGVKGALWNAKEGGWVFSKAREDAVARALIDGAVAERDGPPSVGWADAKPGDRLKSAEPTYLARKRIQPKTRAEAFAAALGDGAYVVQDGMKHWGVVIPRPIEEDEIARVYASVVDAEPAGGKGTDGDKTPSVPPSPAPTVPIADDRQEAKKREARAAGKAAALANEPRNPPDWMGDRESDLPREWQAGYQEGVVQRSQSAPDAPAAAPAQPPANPPAAPSSRLTTRDEGYAAGAAWAKQGGAESFKDDPAMGNASADAKGGWTAGYRATAKSMPAPTSSPQPARPATYGASNSLVSSDRAEEIRKKLRDKLGGGTLNAGIDPEVLSLGAELAVYHVEAGSRKFAQVIRAIAADLGMEVSSLRRYGRAWYNGARNLMEDSDLSIDGMDDDATVRAQMDVLFGEAVEKPASAPDIPKTEAPDDTRRPEGRDPEPLEEPVSPEREETQPRPAGGRGGGAGRPGAGGDSGNAGDGAGGGVVRGPKRLPDDPADNGVAETDPEGIKGENPGNFVIPPDFPLGEGTPGQKLDNNIAAIRLVKALISENRYATPEEQAVLARYVGWGGLPQAFDKKNAEKTDQWGRAYRALKDLLTDQEWRLARNSTRNAHYTSRGIVRSMWAAMRWFGFEGGRALEPTVGTGNFLGLQPEDMGAATEWHASEIDSITGNIAKFLYPNANVFAATGFQDAPFVNGAFDIAIGNPPFGSETIDKGRVPEIAGMKIHNYIIAKAGMHLRPGGIMGMVVTHRFLDTANPEARAALARDFRFIGAFRLPNNAFKENAGTDVVTDVIFLQKLKEGEAPALNAAWLDVNGSVSSGGEAIRVNRYYEENPTHIIGRSAMDGTMYGRAKTEGEYTVHADGRDVEEEIGRIIGEVWASERGALGQRTEALEAAVAVEATSTLPIGGMMLTPDGKIIRREMAGEREITPETLWSDMAEEWDEAFKTAEALKLEQINPSADQTSAFLDAARAITHNAKGEPKTKMTGAEKALFDLAERVRKDGPRFRWRHDKALDEIGKSRNRKLLGVQKHARIKGMLGLRSATLRLIRAEQTDASNIETLRRELRAAYDAFVGKFGFVSDQKNVNALQGDIGVELGLEVDYRPAEDDTPASAKQASILSKRVIFPYSEVAKAETVDDAAAISLIERGRIDLAHVAKLTGRDVSDVRADMAERDNPLIFFDPEGEEWVDAEAYLSGNVRAKLNAAKSARLSRNVSALTAVLPEPKDKSRITPAIRGQWIPTEIFEEFLRAIGIADAQVRIYQDAGTVSVDGNVVQLSEYGQQFQHDRKDVLEMFSAAMKGKAVVIYDRGPNDTRVKNEQATREVNAIIGRMASEFQGWAFENPDRVKRIVDAYNEKMNTHVERKYDGVKYLRLVGANPNVKPRNSQKNGAWRMITSRSALMHHIVGAGKTYTAIMAVMERRRMGLSKKPMIVVPNHLVTQWASDIYNLYPGAKVLAATPADFTKSNRRRLLARIATGDFDVVVIGHSSLGFIPPAEADSEAIITEQMEALEEAIEAARDAEGKKSLSVKNLTKRLEKYEAKLEELRDRPRDELGFDFTTMGVDYVAIDEAQEFKNLEYATAGDRLVGMNDPNGSQRAFDLYVKTRGLLSRKGGVAFLTGTPISNSLVEIYTVLKYLAYDDLKARGEANFDAWSGAYVQAEHRFEYTAAQSLVERRVMSGLVNLESLSALYRNVADIILDDQIREIYADQIREENRANGTNLSERFPTPKVKNGGRVLMNADPTPDQVEFTDYLVARMAAIKSGGRDYMAIDNALWVLTDARKASIDIRTMDNSAQRDPNSKVMRTSREIMRIYEANTDRDGTQLVFADSSTPKKNATAEAKRSVRAALAKTMGDAAARKQVNEWDEAGRLLTSQWTEALRRINDEIDSPDTSADRRDALNEYLASLQDVEAAVLTADSGFSFYDDLRAALIEQGVPASEIEFIHDYDTPQQKKSLFNKVNDGRVRILMGSTAKMGAGTNVQKRLVGLHHVDAPWRPSDVEQREGRIIRQGNMFYEQDPDGFEVEILAYSTRGTSDVVLWQVLERKARSIEKFLNGSLDKMDEEGGDADSYAEFMAQSTGNPVFRLNMEADKALLGEEAATLGRLRARADGVAFLQTADDEIRKAGAALESLRASRVGEFVVDDVRGDPSDFGPTMEEANAAYQKAYDEWMVARNDAEETILRMKEEGADKKAFPKIPVAPAKPNPISREITEKSTYAAAMRAFIQKIADAEIGDDFSAQIGDVRARVQIVDHIGKRAMVDLLAGPADAWIDRKTFGAVDPFTGGLPEYLDPDNIESTRIRTEGWRKENLADLKNRKAFAEKSSKIEVDTAPLDEARAVATFYKKAVRIAEARAEAERAERPNRFIEMDVARPLSGAGSSAIDERPTLVDLKSGQQFEGTGIGASLGNITKDGDSYDAAMFETRRVPDGKLAIITALKKDGAWAAEYVDVIPPKAEAALEAAIVRERRGEAPSAPVTDAQLASLQSRMDTLLPGVKVKRETRPDRRGAFTMTRKGETVDATVLVSSAVDAEATLDHEAIHALYNLGLFTEAEWAALSRRAEQSWIRKHKIKERYPEADAALLIEEAIAEEFAARRAKANALEPMSVRKALAKIGDVLEAIGNWARGLGFQSAADVFGRAGRGEVGRRIVEMTGGQGPFARARVVTAPDGKKRIVAWHGSPHDFDRFDMSKIGSGEGAQVYGPGLYFAEQEGVARHYKEILSVDARNIRHSARYLYDAFQESGIGITMSDEEAYYEVRDNPNWAKDWEVSAAEKKLVEDAMARFAKERPPGRLYQVEIDADPADFIDYDAPLSAQPKILDALVSAFPFPEQERRRMREWSRPSWADGDQNASYADAIKGGTKFNALWAELRSTEEVRKRLLAAGIAGIKYLDGGSRGKGDGTRNYVVFDDSLITIVNKERRDTSTAAFRKWFGKSKVVDANGEPLVVYHGTGQVFDSGDQRRMLWGSAKTDLPEQYAYAAAWRGGKRDGEGAALVPLYMKIERPFDADLGIPKTVTIDDMTNAIIEQAADQGRALSERQMDRMRELISAVRAARRREESGPHYARNDFWYDAPAMFGRDGADAIRQMFDIGGFDGIAMLENGEQTYGVFSPSQAKSVFNRGTWDANSPLIRERRAPANSGAFETFESRSAHQITRLFTRLFTRFEAAPLRDAETWRDTYHIIRRNFADRFDPLKRQQEAIQEAGGNVGLAQDAYLAESLYHGRTGERLRDFYEGDVRGITKNLRDAEIAPKEMDDYLIARHVEERNRQMAKLREIEEPDHDFVKALTDPTIVGGSGFSQAWANGVLRRVANDRRAAMFKEIARKADAINSARLDLEVSSGLTSQEAADAMRATYKFYVPLRGWEADEDGGSMGAGRGFDIRGQESKRAAGRTTRADSPLGTLLAMRANSIIRSEKNRVGKTFLRLVQANPNPAAWSVKRTETKTRIKSKMVTEIDPLTGLPRMVRRDVARDQKEPASRLDENTMIVKVGGEEVLIRIENSDLARAMKNLNPENQSVLVRALGTITRWMSALNTTLNIEWFVTNLARDLQTAGIQISDENKKGLAKAMFKNWPGALRGAAEHLSGRGSSSWRAVAADFAAQGGKVDYIEFRDVQGFKELIEDEITEGSLGRMVKAGPKALFEGIQIFTGAGENAIRIAAYKAALDMGIPKPKAASIARELTVNFNRKGELGPTMNAFFMFFNAAVQGNIRTLISARKSKFTRRVLFGMAILGMLEALLGAGDDDEYEKLEPHITERSLVIMFHPLGLGPKGSYGKIPLPYSYNVFKTIGTQLGRVLIHGSSPEEAASNVLGAAINSFNPIGGQDVLAVLTPTVLDPIVDIYRNRNFFGSSIRPDYPGDQRPDSEKFFPNVNPVSRTLTAWLNDATGGNAFKEGAISVSPENIDHLLGTYLGGAGRFFPNLGRATWGLMTGEPLDAEKAPFVRQLYGETFGEMPTWRAYDSITDAVTALDYEVKGFRKAGQGDAVREAMERDPLLTSMLGPVKIAEKRISALRKKEREIAARDMDEDARIEALALIRQQSLEAQRRLIEIWDRKRNPRS